MFLGMFSLSLSVIKLQGDGLNLAFYFGSEDA